MYTDALFSQTVLTSVTPAEHCSYCDFLSVCMGDRKKAEETLVCIT